MNSHTNCRKVIADRIEMIYPFIWGDVLYQGEYKHRPRLKNKSGYFGLPALAKPREIHRISWREEKDGGGPEEDNVIASKIFFEQK